MWKWRDGFLITVVAVSWLATKHRTPDVPRVQCSLGRLVQKSRRLPKPGASPKPRLHRTGCRANLQYLSTSVEKVHALFSPTSIGTTPLKKNSVANALNMIIVHHLLPNDQIHINLTKALVIGCLFCLPSSIIMYILPKQNANQPLNLCAQTNKSARKSKCYYYN